MGGITPEFSCLQTRSFALGSLEDNLWCLLFVLLNVFWFFFNNASAL